MRVLILLLICAYVSAGRPSMADMEKELDFQARLMKAAGHVAAHPHMIEEWKRRVSKSSSREYELPRPVFECDVVKSETVPTTVHELRPSDIKVIAAFGDSISAGMGLGAASLPEVARENRGEVFSIGGDKDLEHDVITISNIVRKFNPDVTGASHCASSRQNAPYRWMNVALSGDVASGMPSQAEWMVELFHEDERIDFHNDWKLVTMLIGGNDLCSTCRPNRALYTPQMYRTHIERALDILHNNSTRVFVNLVVMFDVTPLKNFTGYEYCDSFHWGICPCIMNNATRDGMKDIQMAYYNELKNLTESGKYDDRDDFTVVLQPHMTHLTPPIDPVTGDLDYTFLSFDCFHPARKAHQGFAYMLWQAMMIPVGQKPCDWDLYETDPRYICPTMDHPYLFTHENSVGAVSPLPGPYCG